MNEIKAMGYVKSHRTGDTGIGKTLEDLLGIKENNIDGPDFDIYELKSGRKNSSSMLTLFTKAPQPGGINKVLRDVFGYAQRTRGINNAGTQTTLSKHIGISEPDHVGEDKELHVTVDALKNNSVGLKLETDADTLYIANGMDVKAYYEANYLREAFEKKYAHKLLYVLATNIREEKVEQFSFDEVYLLDGFNFQRFSECITTGIVKLDIRIGHYPDGRVHDHGTGFRVLPKHLPSCFKSIEKVL